ncbi:MAG: T9SS type A sorting domain-containing protein [Bacteroidales bacterium]
MSFGTKWVFLAFAVTLISHVSIAQQTDHAAACEVTFSDIYDFRSGDIFQYKRTEAVSTGYGPAYNYKITKYQINSQSTSGDTLFLDIEGLVCSYGISPEGIHMGSISSNLKTTLIHVDSLTHRLNACNDTILVNEDEGYYGIVSEYIEGDTIGKRIGGQNGVFLRFNGQFEPAECNHFEEIFAKGLGRMKRFESSCFESWYVEELVGYVKAGDTVGIISSDEELSVGLKESIRQESATIYPNPVKDVLHLPSVQLENCIAGIYSLDGILVKSCILNGTSLDARDLKSGIYILQIVQGESTILFTGRFLKE